MRGHARTHVLFPFHTASNASKSYQTARMTQGAAWHQAIPLVGRVLSQPNLPLTGPLRGTSARCTTYFSADSQDFTSIQAFPMLQKIPEHFGTAGHLVAVLLQFCVAQSSHRLLPKCWRRGLPFCRRSSEWSPAKIDSHSFICHRFFMLEMSLTV